MLMNKRSGHLLFHLSRRAEEEEEKEDLFVFNDTIEGPKGACD
jgi:hypothetical protein